tara:strand:+ start:515 stop:1426 length:912 start_codon:yes stop_codon:yes gene_type:complete
MANQYNNEFESAEIKSQYRVEEVLSRGALARNAKDDGADRLVATGRREEEVKKERMQSLKREADQNHDSGMDVWKKHIEERLSILEKGVIVEQETRKQETNKEVILTEIKEEWNMAMASEQYERAEKLQSEIDSLNASKEKIEMGDIVHNLLDLIHFVEYKSPTMKNWIVVKVKQIYLHDNSVDIEIDGGNIVNTVFKYLRKAEITFNKYKINQVKSWMDLKAGMTKEQVKLILGDPIRVKVDYYGEKWCYIDRDFRERDRYNPNDRAKPGEVVFCNATLDGSSLFDPSRKEEPMKLKYWEET